jgi:toxin-antitoxin system PIN domain toxin
MSLRLFPDVNVWVALHHLAHEHHKVALRWYEALSPQTKLVYCRQTQLGLFRLLTNETVMGDEALTQRECWELYRKWLRGGGAYMLAEPKGVEVAFERRASSDDFSTKAWSDAYLAAFAETGQMTLVTFDRALAGKVEGAVLLS